MPIRVTAFQGHRWVDGRWVAGNITGRKLTNEDFVAWYSDGEEMEDGTTLSGLLYFPKEVPVMILEPIQRVGWPDLEMIMGGGVNT